MKLAENVVSLRARAAQSGVARRPDRVMDGLRALELQG
jgi:hypothetical protein